MIYASRKLVYYWYIYIECFQMKKICLQSRRHEFNPWVRKIPWRRKWQPTPVFLPEESHGPRSLAGYSPWGHKELDTTERLHFTSLLLVTKSKKDPVISVQSLSYVRLFETPWTVAWTKLLRPWDFPSKSTGVGCHFLLQRMFTTQGSNPGLPHWGRRFTIWATRSGTRW